VKDRHWEEIRSSKFEMKYRGEKIQFYRGGAENTEEENVDRPRTLCLCSDTE
jgi:hypothetical protein